MHSLYYTIMNSILFAQLCIIVIACNSNKVELSDIIAYFVALLMGFIAINFA